MPYQENGPELYASIGSGPRAASCAIAQTNFKLTWSGLPAAGRRLCSGLGAAEAVITYVLPKAAEHCRQPSNTIGRFFAAGVRDHAKVHGEMIKRYGEEHEACLLA